MISLGSLAGAVGIMPAIDEFWRRRDCIAIVAIVLSLPGLLGLFVLATFLTSGKLPHIYQA